MMKLHLDTDAFQTLLLDQSEKNYIRADVLEKDYFVSLILQELSEKQKENPLPAYFKGGTALYKALKRIRRFSEDIDLTVFVEDCPSNNQKQKRLEEATKKYTSLPRNEADPANKTEKGAITTVYNYDSVVEVDREDTLQRFEKVKIEATSFTISEPHDPLEIAPLIFENAGLEEREILHDQFEVGPFRVETIRLERIFIDKVFAAEFYFGRNELKETAKHLYDLVIMLGLPEIERLFTNELFLEKLIAIKRQEESTRIGSGLSEIPISSFKYLSGFTASRSHLREFQAMQTLYVMDDQYLLSEGALQEGISQLRVHFKGR